MNSKRNQLFEICLLIYSAIMLFSDSIFLIYEVVNPIVVQVHFLFIFLFIFSLGKLQVSMQDICFILLFLVTQAFALKMNGSGFGNILLLFFTVVVVTLLKRIKITSQFYKRFDVIIIVVWILSAVTSMTFSKNFISNFMAGGEYEGFNPNTVALVLGATCYILISNLSNYRISKKMRNILMLAVMISTLFLVDRCQSRGVFFSMLLIFTLNCFFSEKIKKSYKLATMFYFLIVVLGIIIPYVYVFIWNNPLFKGVVILGKSLFTGRQFIWINLFKYFQNNPMSILFGTGVTTEFYYGKSFNLHNSYLQTIATFGFPVFLLFFGFLCKVIKHAYRNGRISERKKTFLLLSYFLLFIGCFETTFTYMMVTVLIVVAFGFLGSIEDENI